MTTPVEEFTDAIVGSEELHVPPLTVDVNVVVPPTQTFWFPLNVPVPGVGFTVTVNTGAASGQPPVPVTVYVITAVPPLMPLTCPNASIVATAVFDEVHVPPPAVDDNVVFCPTQIF